MIDFPTLIGIIVFVATVFFGLGRATARNEGEAAVLKRIIERKYAKRLEREKVRTAEQLKTEMDAFVRSLTRGAPDAVD